MVRRCLRWLMAPIFLIATVPVVMAQANLASELEQYPRLLQQEASRTGDFHGGAKIVVEAMLQSPHFLFRELIVSMVISDLFLQGGSS